MYEGLHQPISRVLPVSLCPLPGPLYSVLMGYKESPVDEVRVRSAGVVDTLFSEFLAGHRRCISKVLDGFVDVVLPVPSSSRPGQPPLDRVPGLGRHVTERLERGWGWGPALWCPSLLERTPGPIGHMRPNADAFAVPEWAEPIVSRARVLLLDDTYVSGARSQSAAAALRMAGAYVVLIVPLGRVIRPAKLPEHARFLERSRNSRAGRHRCARCVVTQYDAEAWDSGAGAGPGAGTE
jgi:hypothetical protein